MGPQRTFYTTTLENEDIRQSMRNKGVKTKSALKRDCSGWKCQKHFIFSKEKVKTKAQRSESNILIYK